MENNTNKAWWTVGVIVVVLLLAVGGTYLYDRFAPKEPSVTQNPELASNCGLVIESPAAGAAVSFPVTITGTINNSDAVEIGCVWTMFEGQAGVATLHYQTKDGWSLPVDSKPIMVANWMSTSTTFSVTLNYDNTAESLPSGYDFKVILTEENPSGQGTPDKVELPLVLL